MRPPRSLALASFVVAAIAACGGGDSKLVPPDAPTALSGLGQPCVFGMMGADCPANARGCLAFTTGATTGMCSTLCVTAGTLMTDAQAMIATITPDPGAGPQVATCTGIFSGELGSAACTAIVRYAPPDNPPQANKMYTGVDIACTISCAAGGACPGGMQCNTMFNRCEP